MQPANQEECISKLYTEITETPKNNVGLLLGTSPKLKTGITIYILTTVFCNS